VQATTPTPHSLMMPTTARARRWVLPGRQALKRSASYLYGSRRGLSLVPAFVRL